MSTRLCPNQVAHRLAEPRLRTSLTALQCVRLNEITAALAPDGRFLLGDVLVACNFPPDPTHAQDAFRDFRKRINQAAQQARVDVRLELDSYKTTPDRRYGWFTGATEVDSPNTFRHGPALACDHVRHLSEDLADVETRLTAVQETLASLVDDHRQLMALLRERTTALQHEQAPPEGLPRSS